jgi:hypothetical protein
LTFGRVDAPAAPVLSDRRRPTFEASRRTRLRFNESSAKGLVATPQDRASTARSPVEAFGGKPHQFYFSFGD